MFFAMSIMRFYVPLLLSCTLFIDANAAFEETSFVKRQDFASPLRTLRATRRSSDVLRRDFRQTPLQTDVELHYANGRLSRLTLTGVGEGLLIMWKQTISMNQSHW